MPLEENRFQLSEFVIIILDTFIVLRFKIKLFKNINF